MEHISTIIERIMMKASKNTKPICHICGDTGRVSKAYIDGKCSLNQMLQTVPCPKCRREDLMRITTKEKQ